MPNVVITGNRPQKLGGFNNDTVKHSVKEHLRSFLRNAEPYYVYTGMALGVDQWAAEICIEEGIPFIAAIPFYQQPKLWPETSRKHYQFLIKKAQHKIYVDRTFGFIDHKPDIYKPSKLHRRNEWMVNQMTKEDVCFGIINDDIISKIYTEAVKSGTWSCLLQAEDLHQGSTMFSTVKIENKNTCLISGPKYLKDFDYPGSMPENKFAVSGLHLNDINTLEATDSDLPF